MLVLSVIKCIRIYIPSHTFQLCFRKKTSGVCISISNNRLVQRKHLNHLDSKNKKFFKKQVLSKWFDFIHKKTLTKTLTSVKQCFTILVYFDSLRNSKSSILKMMQTKDVRCMKKPSRINLFPELATMFLKFIFICTDFRRFFAFNSLLCPFKTQNSKSIIQASTN